MIPRLAFFVALAFGTSLVMADAAKPFVGTWSAEWQYEKQSYEASMVITATGGTWQTAAKRRNNPCFGREVSLQHDVSNDSTLEMTLKFSDVIPDCKDAKVKLQVDANGHVTGQRGNVELTLKREKP